MSELTTTTYVIPKFLFITNVTAELRFREKSETGAFRGKYEEQEVELRLVDNDLNNVRVFVSFVPSDIESSRKDLIQEDFRKQVLEWRSISHRFVIPLLGIFAQEPRLFLVSPFMKNGTLNQWRREQERDVDEIQNLVRFLLWPK